MCAQPLAPVLSRNVTQITINELLSDIDLDNYERSTTKYRKPSYQRGLKKDYKWGEQLIESILEGMSIGSIHLSQWTHHEMVEGENVTDEYFNIEDGQTRLNSLIEFKNEEFSTKYGDYNDESIRTLFNSYSIPVVMFNKKNSRIRDSVYFEALCENFSRLQEGTALTASDRYWSSVAAPDVHFAGSPIVNYTLEIVNCEIFRQYFQDYMGINNLSQRNEKMRNNLANMIGLISGAWKGSMFSNSKYFIHVPIMQNDQNGRITDEDKIRICKQLKQLFNIIQTAIREFPKYPHERFSALFNTTHKFTGAMLIDLQEVETGSESEQQKIDCWKKFINHYRNHKYQDNLDQFLENIYANLTTGQKRNVTEPDIRARLDAVHQWYETLEE